MGALSLLVSAVRERQQLQTLCLDGLRVPTDARLQALCEAAAESTCAPTAIGALALAHTNVHVVSHGLSAARAIAGASAREGSFCALVVASEGPVLVTDAEHDPRTPPGFLAVHETRSYLGVPLSLDGTIVGTLSVTDVVPRRFPPFSTTHLLSLATWLSRALWGAALHRVHRASVRPRAAEGRAADLARLLGDFGGRLDALAAALDRLATTGESRRFAALDAATRALDLHAACTDTLGMLATRLAAEDVDGAAEDALDELHRAGHALAELRPRLRVIHAHTAGRLSATQAVRLLSGLPDLSLIGEALRRAQDGFFASRALVGTGVTTRRFES